jgi:hypothetical protein
LFWLDGGRLDETFKNDPDQWAANLGSLYQAGFSPQFEIQDLNMNVFHDVAVFTCYVTGAIVLPGGGSISGTWRDSGTWVRHDGEWKEAHAHFSPLTVINNQNQS